MAPPSNRPSRARGSASRPRGSSRPPGVTSQPWRYLGVLVALLIVMLATIVGGAALHPGSWHTKFRVGLGLDLSSGTVITLKAVAPHGGVPTSSQMSTAIDILTSRVNGKGFTGAQVQQQGSQYINISIPGKSAEQVQPLLTAAQLRFRQVLLCTTPIPGAPECVAGNKPAGAGLPSAAPAPSSSPVPVPSPSPSGTPTSSPSASASGSAGSGQAAGARQLLARGRAHAAPAASSSPKPSTSASAGASGSSSPAPSGSASPSPSASASQSPGTLYVTGDESAVKKSALALFAKVNCADSKWQSEVYGTDSAKWNAPKSQIVSCDHSIKYVLGPAIVLGEWLKSPSAGLDSTNQWVVNFNLNGQGAKAFGTQTTSMYTKYFNASTNSQTSALDQFAIVLDGKVVSAPRVQQPITTGQGQISGSFTKTSATNLANVLKYGALPLSFQSQQSNSVSATLGHAQLTAGLIAAAIGLLLVVIYSVLYYRGLAIVSVFSLATAALLSWLSVILLSKYQGYTLSLAGVAGLIVAIGITADSFVVYFERLRDEVREGRSLRAAVERGWQRARRTIIVSDTVSFLAALLLYLFAIGDVRGFAFTLGLTTLIDIVVVFMFTKPMVTLLAGRRFFGQGHRWSGLDPTRLGANSRWRGSKPATARPATGGVTTATSATAARTTPREA